MKKQTLIATVIAAVALPALASADPVLATHNNTNETSAVRVTSGSFKGQCSGTVPAKLRSIAPPGYSSVPWRNVQGLCLNSGNVCTAEIHMTPDCSDPAIATASLDLGAKVVTVGAQPETSRYVVTASGTDVFLNYK